MEREGKSGVGVFVCVSMRWREGIGLCRDSCGQLCVYWGGSHMKAVDVGFMDEECENDFERRL